MRNDLKWCNNLQIVVVCVAAVWVTFAWFCWDEQWSCWCQWRISYSRTNKHTHQHVQPRVGHGSIFRDPIQSINLWIQSNTIQSGHIHNSHPIQCNPIHKYLVLNRTRKLRAANYSIADIW